MAQADFLRTRVAEGLADRLELIDRDFAVALDLGSRGGAFGRVLAARPELRVGPLISSDLSARLVNSSGVVLDEERLPFRPAAFDLVVSALTLHWTNDLPGVLTQVRRVLKPGGVLLATLFAGATLVELRRVLLEAESEVGGGAGWRVAPFADPRDLTGLLQRAGFSDPTGEIESITVRYASVATLLADLRRMGESAVMHDRGPPLSRAALARAEELYHERYGAADGRLPATFETVTLTGRA